MLLEPNSKYHYVFTQFKHIFFVLLWVKYGFEIFKSLYSAFIRILQYHNLFLMGGGSVIAALNWTEHKLLRETE